jgi:hypothetical protein
MAKRRPRSDANDTASSQAAPSAKTRKAPVSRRSLATAPEAIAFAAPPEPTEADIRHRAYLRYLERGGDDGRAVDDWIYAEQELKKN